MSDILSLSSPFLHPAFLEAGQRYLPAPDLKTFSSGSLSVSFEVCRPIFLARAPMLRVWAHDYAPLGGVLSPAQSSETDLSEKDFGEFLDEFSNLALEDAKAQLLFWPFFPAEEQHMHWLSRWCAQKGWGSVLPIRTHERACLSLDRGQPHGGLNLRAKKRKEYQRQLRRLGDIGAVSFCSTAEGSDCQSGLEESLGHFFALEAAGWKGQRGTALVSNPDTKAFVAAFLPDMVADGSARIDWIKVGDQPVASLISLKAGAGLFTWKIGYDPTFARFSPGVQIMLDLSKQALKDPDLTFIDSLATQGHPMVDHIWPHRRAMASLLVPLGPKGARQARQAALYYRSYDQLRASAKQLLRR